MQSTLSRLILAGGLVLVGLAAQAGAVLSLPSEVQARFNQFLGEVVLLRDEPSAAQVNAVRKINRKTKKAFRDGRSGSKCLGDIAKVLKIAGDHFDEGDPAVPLARTDLIESIILATDAAQSSLLAQLEDLDPKPKNADKLFGKIEGDLDDAAELLPDDDAPLTETIGASDAVDAIESVRRAADRQARLQRKIDKARKKQNR